MFPTFLSKFWTGISDKTKIILDTCICRELDMMRGWFVSDVYVRLPRTEIINGIQGIIQIFVFAKKFAQFIPSSSYSRHPVSQLLTPLFLSLPDILGRRQGKKTFFNMKKITNLLHRHKNISLDDSEGLKDGVGS